MKERQSKFIVQIMKMNIQFINKDDATAFNGEKKASNPVQKAF